jgi:hypothetical protein
MNPPPIVFQSESLYIAPGVSCTLYVEQAIKRLIKDSTKHADAMRELTEEVRASRRAAVVEDRKLDSLFGPMRTKQQELRDELEREKVGRTNKEMTLRLRRKLRVENTRQPFLCLLPIHRVSTRSCSLINTTMSSS